MKKASLGWRTRNAASRVKGRLTHPWPLYRAVGGINAVVTHADGSQTNYGRASVTYMKRWNVGAK